MKKDKKLLSCFILLKIFFLFSCNSNVQIEKDFNSHYSAIANDFIKDKTLEINEVFLNYKKKSWVLEGKTSNKKVYKEVKSYAESRSYFFEVNLLPDTLLNDSIYGLVNVSVTPLRQEPKHSSQMVDQVIMGNYVRLHEQKGDWFLCQSEYDYVGWINKSAIVRCDELTVETWLKNSNYMIQKSHSTIYSEPDKSSLPISDIILNNVVWGTKTFNNWTKVILPDNRKGFILTEDLILANRINHHPNGIQKSLVYKAKKLIGTPYIWGGNSSKGSDCSGFTQTVFKAVGVSLPRDARQQAVLGKKININNALSGDLLFFGDGEKVTHVGISLGEMNFIHQGGKVDIHSLDSNSILYNNYRAKSFMFLKRILDEG
jgi:cell wall-associated NlpC family hydrolase